MVPVGAILDNRETCRERLTRSNASEADARHSIHFRWQDEPVPVHRGFLIQQVGYLQYSILSFAQAYQGPWAGSIERNWFSHFACDRQRFAPHGKGDCTALLDSMGVDITNA